MRKYSIGMMVVMTTSVLGIKPAFAQTKSLELFWVQWKKTIVIRCKNPMEVLWHGMRIVGPQ